MKAQAFDLLSLETDSLDVGGNTITDFDRFKVDNAVLNGAFNIAQRGTSVPINSTVLYGLDGWKTFKIGSAVLDMNQYVGGPTFAQSGYKSTHSLEMDVTTANASLGTSDYLILSHPVEGLRITPFIGKTVTLSFWLMATKTGATCVKVIAYGEGKEILKEFTISQSLTWEKHTWTFELDSSMSFNQDETAGLGINFSLGAGTNYQGAATETWSDFTYQCTSNQVNHMDNTANVFRLSQVQLEIGDAATPYKGVDPALELEQCQRYYEKSYSQGVDPGTATTDGACIAYPMALSTRGFLANGTFAVVKRTIPTIYTWDQSGNSSKCNDYNNSTNQYTISSISSDSTGIWAPI